jgi:glutamine synthetase
VLDLEQLRAEVESGAIDTVVVALVDMQGRLVGKRTDAAYFLEHVDKGIHACNSLLTLDMESDTTPGYAIASIDLGYGDFMLHPDLATLRRLPWHEATALALCDPRWFDGRGVEESPRAILGRQVERARAIGFEPMFASELEFYVCRETYDEVHASEYSRLTPTARYVTDAHLLAPGFDEPLISRLRRSLRAAGVPVETSKAEAWAGQHEITFRYGDPVSVADHHVIFKHGAKEIAAQNGCSITFMAKPDHTWMGNSCHVHSSLWRDAQNAFEGETDVFRHYLAGQIACLRELAIFLAPTVNSYKRFFGSGTWAGSTITWAYDNRTTGVRVIGEGESFRVECRIPGADCNPYLAFAALLAAGLHGIENDLQPPPAFEGNAYASDAERFPPTLRDAIAELERGSVARAAFGDAVVDHYLNYARAEQRLFDQVVTDYELARMFERG